jgi:hypothetical protein
MAGRGGVPFQVREDVESLDQWLDDIERRVSRSVAASTLTSLARGARTDSIKQGASAIQVPTAVIRKRIRAFRATPKRLASGVIATVRDIPETTVGARQKGHPGRPRTSSTPNAVAARKRRKAQGAKAPRRGGVTSKGRGFPGAWVGKRKDGKGGKHAIRRVGSDLEFIHREFGPVRTALSRNYKAQGKRWPVEFGRRFTEALRRRGRGRTATFLERNV